MEKIQIIYKNGTNIVIDACNGAYTTIRNELAKKKPAKYVRSPKKSIYNYMVSLEDVIGVRLVNDETITTTFGFIR